MPIGIARRAETSTGRQFDGWVLGVGAVAVGAAIVGLTALASWMLDRLARQRDRPGVASRGDASR